MSEQSWDLFVIYVNAYYAVQEAYDSARRNWERPAPGLDVFCRNANPFLWDGHASAEEAVYEDFAQQFRSQFGHAECTGSEGHAFSRTWLATLEGDQYGSALVSSFDSITDERSFTEACEPIHRQLAARAMRLERTPQDEPFMEEAPVPTPTPTSSDIDAVIALLAKGDEAFAASLRARLDGDEVDA